MTAPAPMPSEEISQERFISIEEAAKILEMSENEIRELVSRHALVSYRIGPDILRLKREQVWDYKSKTRIDSDLFPNDRVAHHQQSVGIRASLWDRMRDFFYFNDFYIFSFIAGFLLIYWVVQSR